MTISEIAERIRALIPDMDAHEKGLLSFVENPNEPVDARSHELGKILISHIDVLLRDPVPPYPLDGDVNADQYAQPEPTLPRVVSEWLTVEGGIGMGWRIVKTGDGLVLERCQDRDAMGGVRWATQAQVEDDCVETLLSRLIRHIAALHDVTLEEN